MSMLAVGFAARVRPAFAWANCSGSTTHWERAVVEALERGSVGHAPGRVDAHELRVLEAHPVAVDRLVVRDPQLELVRGRLVDFVRLPLLFQRLISQYGTPEAPISVVLTNADAFRSSSVETTLANPRLHETLRREGISLSVTFRGDPPSTMKEAFDHVLRVEPSGTGDWADARVMAERGLDETRLLLPQSLRDAWRILGLSPRLLTGARAD
jgi:hypothetical protein